MKLGRSVPSGKRPLSPLTVFLPRNHPSPKSSSRSISSMRSPRARLSSSGLLAWNSSATSCQPAVSPSPTVGRVQECMNRRFEGANSRTTIKMSPGREPSVCGRAAMMGTRAKEEKRVEEERRGSRRCWRLPPARDVNVHHAAAGGRLALQTWRRTSKDSVWTRKRMQRVDGLSYWYSTREARGRGFGAEAQTTVDDRGRPGTSVDEQVVAVFGRAVETVEFGIVALGSWLGWQSRPNWAVGSATRLNVSY